MNIWGGKNSLSPPQSDPDEVTFTGYICCGAVCPWWQQARRTSHLISHLPIPISHMLSTAGLLQERRPAPLPTPMVCLWTYHVSCPRPLSYLWIQARHIRKVLFSWFMIHNALVFCRPRDHEWSIKTNEPYPYGRPLTCDRCSSRFLAESVVNILLVLA